MNSNMRIGKGGCEIVNFAGVFTEALCFLLASKVTEILEDKMSKSA